MAFCPGDSAAYLQGALVLLFFHSIYVQEAKFAEDTHSEQSFQVLFQLTNFPFVRVVNVCFCILVLLFLR